MELEEAIQKLRQLAADNKAQAERAEVEDYKQKLLTSATNNFQIVQWLEDYKRFAKTAQWEKTQDLPVVYKCSNCHSESSFRYNFCPACGSRMDLK